MIPSLAVQVPPPSLDFALPFVSDPGAAIDQRARGPRKIGLELASHRFGFFGLSDSQYNTVRSLYHSYLTAGPMSPDDDHRIDFFEVSRDSFSLFERRGWTYDMAFEFAPGVVWVAGWGFLGLVRTGSLLRSSLWTCLHHSHQFHSVFENFLRIVLAYTLVEKGGLLLHSAGIVLKDQAHLFIGQSGAGKSTLCGISKDAGFKILSDDLNAVVLKDSMLEAERLPFAGEPRFRSVGTDRYQVAGLYKLRKSNKCVLNDLSPGSAIATLCGNTPFVNRNPYMFDELVRIAKQLIRFPVVRELSFLRDGSFLELLGASD